MTRIAIIGAGMTGLALAFFLASESSRARVTLIDRKGIGGGASGIAAGLLHEYGGLRARLSVGARESARLSLELIQEMERRSSRLIATRTGLYRLGVTPEKEREFQLSASLYEELSLVNYLDRPALFVPNAWVVDCPLYLSTLWSQSALLGVEFETTAITSAASLFSRFDQVVIAAGAWSRAIPEASSLSIGALKGQVLEKKITGDFPYATPFTTSGYVIPLLARGMCLVGATFERAFTSEEPDLALATRLLEDVTTGFPPLDDLPVTRCLASLRATAPGYLPLAKRVADKVWVATGLGSKGLLYHAWLAREVMKSLLSARG